MSVRLPAWARSTAGRAGLRELAAPPPCRRLRRELCRSLPARRGRHQSISSLRLVPLAGAGEGAAAAWLLCRLAAALLLSAGWLLDAAAAMEGQA